MEKTEKYAIYSFPFGFLEIRYEGTVITGLDQTNAPDQRGVRTLLTDQAYTQIIEYLQGRRRSFDFPYELRGTSFQKKVWKELCRIPYGETRTYKEIATATGNPRACRAVGMANHKNPIIIAVPCHRVIGSDGSLTGYAGGIEMKAALLQLEREHMPVFLSAEEKMSDESASLAGELP